MKNMTPFRAGLALLLALAALIAPSGAAAASIRVVAPHTDQLFTKRSVKVKVESGHDSSHLTVTLDGKSVSKDFHRVSPGVWTARLQGKGLVAGENNLVVSTRGKGGGRDYRSGRFIVGKRSGSLLTVKAPRRAIASAASELQTH